jgi:hypothetical protein
MNQTGQVQLLQFYMSESLSFEKPDRNLRVGLTLMYICEQKIVRCAVRTSISCCSLMLSVNSITQMLKLQAMSQAGDNSKVQDARSRQLVYLLQTPSGSEKLSISGVGTQIVQTGQPVKSYRRTFMPQIALACVVFWLFGFVFGLIAFILASKYSSYPAGRQLVHRGFKILFNSIRITLQLLTIHQYFIEGFA